MRLTCGDNIIKTTLLPKLMPLLHEYPDIKLEFDGNYGFRVIVADRFDAGVRFGETIAKDMIAIPIGPAMRMAAVAASPSSLGTRRPNAARPGESPLHQHPVPDLRRLVRLGHRASRPKIERSCGWAIGLQHRNPYHGGRSGRDGHRLSPGSRVLPVPRGRTPDTRAGRLVSSVPRLLPVLPQPPAAFTRICLGARRAPIPALTETASCAVTPASFRRRSNAPTPARSARTWLRLRRSRPA